MTEQTAIRLFEDKNIRVLWNNEQEKWYFAIADVVAVLTQSVDPQAYWRKLKQRLREEGNETVTNCHGLKFQAADGKMRVQDAADTEQLLRLVQSIPSPKAEPFKLWLARVGSERLDEMEDPEAAIQRALDYYARKGYSEGWIMQRLKSIEIRKELTNEWDRSGIQKGKEYAILTDELTRAWSGMSTRQYKDLKGLRKESLRDNMTNLELVLNMLAEVSTTDFAKDKQPRGMSEHMAVVRRGGKVAAKAKAEYELEHKKPATSSLNANRFKKAIKI